jgi:RNA polymerase sigma-70 factor (ECF subfamily)
LGIRTTIRAYVFGIARHVLWRFIRERYTAEMIDIDLLRSSIASLDPSLSTVVGEQMATQRMVLALQRLPIDTQTLIELRYVSGLTTAELAYLYEVPVGTVKSRLSSARTALEAEVQRPALI